MNPTDWIGAIGVAILLIAFFLNLTHRISTESTLYIALNLIGAFVAMIASIMLHFVPFIILELAWVIVSAYSLIKKFIEHKKSR